MNDDEPETPALDRAAAQLLADRICAGAVQQARATCQLLQLIGEFDAGQGWSLSDGMKSMAHWLSFTCAMTAGTAREHVRVARALRRMPTVSGAFSRGELSYSKVRELTRVVDLIDEARLCELARYATASQLARTIAAYRTAAGTRIRQEDRCRFRLVRRSSDQLIGVSGVLTAEDGAILDAALSRARDLNGTPPQPDPGGAPADADRPSTASDRKDASASYGDREAIRDICTHYLNTAVIDDTSGEDRSLVVIEVAAEQLLDLPISAPHVPAGTSSPTPEPLTPERPAQGASPAVTASECVPAGTPPLPTADPAVAGIDDVPSGPEDDAHTATNDLRSEVCTIRGAGPIEPETAQRMICTGTVLGAIIDRHGDILALGRSRRLVSKPQRRALMLRDRVCQFPGCTRTRHLEAHHVVPWSHGGATDLDNLILLCRWHHTTVHEGGIAISRTAEPIYEAAQTGATGWQFRLPDGRLVAASGWRVMSADRLQRELADQADAAATARRNNDLTAAETAVETTVETAVEPGAPIDPDRIRTIGGGAGFQLVECVRVLFDMTLDDGQRAA